jgi:hypothetical protein
MKPALCPCGASAEYSVCVLVSTLSVRPRRQKCGHAQLFCASCIQSLVAEQGDDHGTSAMRGSLRSAYTALLEISGPLLPSTVGNAQGTCIRAEEELVSEG